MIVSVLKYLGLFILIILIQMYILNNIFIGNYYAFLFQPQLIIMFLLLLPASLNHNWLIVISFAAGFLFDVFFQSVGIHAAVSTFIGFTRFYVTRDVEKVIAARHNENQIWTSKKGNNWKWTYFISFIGIYQLLFLLIESLGHNLFSRILPAFISSTVITFILVLILENLLYKPARN